MKSPLFSFCLVLLFAGVLAAGPRPWPDKTLRGSNVAETVTEADIAHFADNWKANSVRILVNDLVPDTPPYKPSEAQKKKVFDCVDLCLRHGLYTVLSFSASFNDNDKFFANPELKAAYLEFWKEVAARYADSSGIAYDLMNEPHDNLAETQWLPFAKELTRAIRAIDKVHTIVVEPPAWGWSAGFKDFEPTGDPNTVYSFHFYGPMDYTHQRNNGHMKATKKQWEERVYPGPIQGENWDKERFRKEISLAAAFRDKYKVRLWCGEFGVARWAKGAFEWDKDWIDALEEQKIGWSYYSYREWYPMDMEMDPDKPLERTPRTETKFVKLFKSYFAKGN
jgi:endoglucanase